ncbi:MAG: homoserine kinase [Candidatus Acidiferrales bacterium]
MNKPRQSTFEVRVPASTANLGAGFDCFGLALQLYLAVRATVLSGSGNRSQVRSRGAKGSSLLARVPEENLIFRAMKYAAEGESFSLPPVRLAVHNAIPVAAGLGSSAAAVVAGVALAFAVAGRTPSTASGLRYATELEGHADNAAAAFLGGLVVTAARADGTVLVVRKAWPKEIRIVAVTPDLALETKKARAVLPSRVSREDAVYNLQRSALLIAALEEKRFDLLWDAMHDRLHQSCRGPLIPGLAGILQMPRAPGLLGIALSGSGPSVIALATDHFDEIGESIAGQFERHRLAVTIRCLDVSPDGHTLKESSLEPQM